MTLEERLALLEPEYGKENALIANLRRIMSRGLYDATAVGKRISELETMLEESRRSIAESQALGVEVDAFLDHLEASLRPRRP